jgi:hypothetical protein
MRENVVIVGLPGSGKSHLGAQMAAQAGVPFFDDATALPSAPGFVLTHPELCKSDLLDQVVAQMAHAWPGVPVRLVFFANDAEQALRNAATRPGKPVAGLIRHLARAYAPPADALPVWTP